MLRYFIPFLFLFSSSLWADAKVRFYDPNDVELYASNSTAFTNSFRLEVDESGESTTDASPAITYSPLYKDASPSANPAVDHFTQLPQSMVPEISSGGLKLRLKLTNTDGAVRYLYAAYKANDSTYRVIGNTGTPHYLTTVADGTTDLDYQAIVDLKVLCDREADDSTLACNAFTIEKEDDTILYFFLTDDATLSNGTTLSGDTNDGVYLKAKFSNKINGSINVTLDDLRRGDGRLIADFNGTAINEMLKIRALVKTASFSGGAGLNTIYTTASELQDLGTIDVTGQATVLNLTNGTRYYIAVAFENKYQIVTNLSNVLFETPQDIQALLEKQACFILSAGFQEEHFVTDFFQDFRDTILGRFWLGRKFIQFYYQTAPHYTGFIIKTPWLAATIRIFAYIVYGILKFWWLGLSLLVLTGLYFPLKKLKFN